MIINTINFRDILKEIKENNYNLSTLFKLIDKYMFDEPEDFNMAFSEDFNNTYSSLMYYVDNESANNKEEFKEIINDLLGMYTRRIPDKYDVSYILNKSKILNLVYKYKQKKITKNILLKQLIKIFSNKNTNEILEYLRKYYSLL